MAYEHLLQLVGNNPRQLAALLEIFITSATADLAALDDALAGNDCLTIRHMAHRMAAACLQLEENTAGQSMQALEALAQTGRAEGPLHIQAAARQAIREVQAARQRAAAFIAPGGGD